jgi:hypothetical protein
MWIRVNTRVPKHSLKGKLFQIHCQKIVRLFNMRVF